MNNCIVAAIALLFMTLSTHVLAATGRTPGQFAVSPTGGAQYSIPLWTPPGIRGIQPKLSLTYDSHLGYGLMGPGWKLGGLSVIARCNPTYAQDGTPAPITLTSADGLCVDGNRLRTTGTSTYQTEFANFSQVTASGTAGNGPSYFIVQGKDGLTYEYGNTTDSKILPSSSVATPYIWALDKVTDRSGNQMTFTYSQAGGAYVPLSIQYTAPSGSTTYSYQISLGYSTLVSPSPNILTRYVAGSQVQQSNQLATITASAGSYNAAGTGSGTVLREYKLLYTASSSTQRATLTSIQECANPTGSGGSATDCLLATTVGYQSGQSGIPNPTTATGSGTPVLGSVNTADFNGDGKADIIYATTNGSTYSWWVQFSNGSGFSAPVNTGAVTSSVTQIVINDFAGTGTSEILAPNGTVWTAYLWNGSSFSATTTNANVPTAATSFASANAHGNGLPDFFYLSSGTLYELANTTTGSSISFASSAIAVYSGLTGIKVVVFGANGITNSNVKHMDFDGDGREDLLVEETGPRSVGFQVLLSRGSTFIAGPSLSGNVLPVTWNDDHCTDLTGATSSAWVVYLSACNGSTATTIPGPSITYAALDWNGDGRTDLLGGTVSSTTLQVQTSSGYGISAATSTSISEANVNNWVVLDSDGDGLDDLLAVTDSSPYTISYALHNGAGVHPDLANSFVDGFGNSISPSYGSIPLYTGYYPYHQAAYPLMEYDGPFYVATGVVFSDPSTTGGTYSQTYYYAGAAMDLQGRGFSGFSAYQRWDSRNGVWENWNYNRAFPYAMVLSSDWVTQDNYDTIWINKLTNTLTYSTLDGTVNNQRYFVYASNVTDLGYEVGGQENAQLMSTTSTAYTYDTYGNATNVATTVTDNDPGYPNANPYYNQIWTTTKANTIAANTSTWCLSLPTQTSVTNTAPSTPSITRTVAFTPDYANCRQTQRIIEPSSATYKVTEVYGYDTSTGNFGNLHTDTVTGIGMSARVTTYNWTINGQFLQSIVNPLSQSTTFVFDPNSGMPTSVSDANGVTTAWQYDDFARKSKETRPDNTYTVWTYYDCVNFGGCLIGAHALSLLHNAYNSDGSSLTNGTDYFDPVDRPLMKYSVLVTGSNERQELRYDSLGRVATQSMPCVGGSLTTLCPYWTVFNYDILNRITQSQRPISATNSTPQTTVYGYSGRTSAVRDALGNTTTWITQVTGNLGRSLGMNGYYQNFAYDAFGSLLSVTDSASPANPLSSATYAYGIQPFKTSSNDMDLGPRSYTVDPLGEITAYSDNKSQSFSATFDALSRPKTRTEPDLTTTWTWGATAASHNIGALQGVTAVGSVGTFSESYTYDSDGRLSTKSVSLPGDSTYTYTTTYSATTGLLDTLQYPTSTSYQLKLQYGYANGLLKSIADFNAPTTMFWTVNAASPRGQVTQETLGNGVITNRVYDAVTGWLGSIQAGAGGGSGLQNNAFLYDDDGNVTQQQDNNQGLTENFYYDNMNRLDHSTLGGTINLQMTYDTLGMGNISARSDVAAGTAWTYDPVKKHQVIQAGSSAYTYTYDGNGNANSRNGSAIQWWSYNYPMSISASGEEVQFWYGSERQRWKEYYTGSVGTEVTYRPDKLLEKVVNGSTIDYRHYIYAGGELVGVYSRLNSGTNTMRYTMGDHQGSIASIDTSGSPVTDYVNESFTAFGNRRNGETWSGVPTTADENAINGVSRRGYTGEIVLGVSMGLNHLNGRVEDAITGRFLSPDPYVPDPKNTQSFNRYSFVNNNPLTMIDPTGFDALCQKGGVGCGGGGGADLSGWGGGWSCIGYCGVTSADTENSSNATNNPIKTFDNMVANATTSPMLNSISDSSNGTDAGPADRGSPQSQVTLDAVTVTAQSTSNQGVPVVLPNGQMVSDQFSPTGNLMSPVADLSAIVVTGRRIGNTYSTLLNSPEASGSALPYLLSALNEAVGQGGTYDYQRRRNPFNGKYFQLRQFRDVSNFNVGLITQAAGLTIDETLSIAGDLAYFESSNYSPNNPYGLSLQTAAFIRSGFAYGQSGAFGP